MKVAHLMCLIHLPDDFEGGCEQVIQFMADRPKPYSSGLVKDVSPELIEAANTATIFMEAAAVSHWPVFEHETAKGFRVAALMAAFDIQEGGIHARKVLNPLTFKPTGDKQT
jgi:hypothetical protein